MDDLISWADVEQTIKDNILCYTHSDRPIDQDPDTECHMAIRTALRMLRKDLRKLPSVQPKQTNCEYCHTYRDGYVFPLEKNCHAFIDRDKIVLKAKGWRGEAKIKYCPICGRRLTGG
jgi:hypothetical protein